MLSFALGCFILQLPNWAETALGVALAPAELLEPPRALFWDPCVGQLCAREKVLSFMGVGCGSASAVGVFEFSRGQTLHKPAERER